MESFIILEHADDWVVTTANNADGTNFHGIFRELIVDNIWYFEPRFFDIGYEAGMGPGGTGGYGGAGGGGGIPCSFQEGLVGKVGGPGNSGRTGGPGGLGQLQISSPWYVVNEYLLQIGGRNGSTGLVGGHGVLGGIGGAGGVPYSNGLAGMESINDYHPDFNGGAAGLWPSGTGGNGTHSGGGGGGGGSSIGIGGGYGAGGGPGDNGSTGSGGTASQGSDYFYPVNKLTFITQSCQVGGIGGEGGRGGQGGHGGGGGGGAGECWGNPRGYGGLGGSGGVGGPGGAGGPGGPGLLELLGGHLRNKGTLEIGRGSSGGSGTVQISNGGILTNYESGEVVINSDGVLETLDATTTIINNGVITVNYTSFINYGLFTGYGSVVGSFVNYGQFAPGNSLGVPAMSSYQEFGELVIELGGTSTDPLAYDRISVDSLLQLAPSSVLVLDFAGGFSEDDLTFGDQFDILHYLDGMLVGEFGSIDDSLAPVSLGMWNIIYDADIGGHLAVRLVYDADPTSSVSTSDLPVRFALNRVYPNPFNPRATISYDLPKASVVDFRIYDVAGRLVWELVGNVSQPAGRHQIVWDGTGRQGNSLSSGTYLLRMKAGDFQATASMVLVR